MAELIYGLLNQGVDIHHVNCWLTGTVPASWQVKASCAKLTDLQRRKILSRTLGNLGHVHAAGFIDKECRDHFQTCAFLLICWTRHTGSYKS